MCYQLVCDRSNVLDLDSTTPSKFSRHLIFHLPHAVFKNNIHAGVALGWLWQLMCVCMFHQVTLCTIAVIS